MFRVSDLIKEENIKTWNEKTPVIIKAGTGAGKSYFVKNVLYDFAKQEDKKILFLIHRTDCVNQFQKEIERDGKEDIIDICTYQSLENTIMKNRDCDLSIYRYIISDEFHYFMSDNYNITTDISLNLILNQEHCIKVFMSATGDDVSKYIKYIKKIGIVEYELPYDYSHIDDLTFFYKDNTLYEFAEECIEKNQKAIFFIESAKKAYDLYEKFKDNSVFNCSKHNKEYIKYVDRDKMDSIFINERFEENILITTTCMDAGVNIIDLDLHHIVCDVSDVGVLIQCIGRKRIQNDEDKVNIYIKSITNKQLGGMETQLKLKINKAEFLKDHTVEEYIKKYPRTNDWHNIVYDDISYNEDICTKRINELMYYKCKVDIAAIEIMKHMGNFGYSKYISQIFGKEKYRLIEEEKKMETLEEYLESIVGKRLFKEEQKELKEQFNIAGLTDRTMGINTLNGKLKDEELPYIITTPKRKSYRDEQGNVKKEKSHWMICKIVSEL